LGLGLIIPTDNLLIAEISSSSEVGSSASAVSLLNFFWGVGAVFCSLMVAWSAAHQLVPLFLGSVAVFLVLLALTIRNLPFPTAAIKSAESSASSSWRELAKSPTIWLFAAVFFLYPGAETAVGGWIGSYVSRMGLRGAAMASMMPAFFWSALTVGRGLGTAVLHHFSERRVLRAGFAAGAAGIGLMLWAPSLAGVIGGALITGLSFATLYPITVARLSQRFGVAARSIGAVMFSLAAVGPAVIPWMVGVISHSSGSLRAGLLLPLGATVILFVIHLFEW
jgi:fucose permease